jgi:hypothetical protein
MNIVRAMVCGALLVQSMSAGAQGTIDGTVYDSLRTRAPLENATVVLLERSKYATTDALGRFRIDSVPDGHYTLGFMHPVLDSLDLEGPVVAVDVSGGHAAVVTLATPGASTLYARICGGAHDAETGVVIGRISDVDARKPLGAATVSTDWTEFTLVGSRPVGHRMRVATKTSANGTYALCGVPTNVAFDLTGELAGFKAGPAPLDMEGRMISRVDLALSLKDSAARGGSTGDSSAVTASAHGTATLRGVAHNAEGKPLRDAVVGVLGTVDSARTDAAGAFVVEHIPAGTRTVELRSIGMLPERKSIDFATNAVRDVTLTSTRKAQNLATVAVEGESVVALATGFAGFEARREHGLGRFVTPQDISKHSYPDLVSILRDAGGVTVECNATKVLQGISCYPMAYMLGVSGPRGVKCVPNYYLNGVQFLVDGPGPPARHPLTDLNAAAPPSAIRGVEIYNNPGQIPAEYDQSSSTGCGSVVIWTR